MKLTRKCLNDLRAYLEMRESIGAPVGKYEDMSYLLELRQEFRDAYGITIEQAETNARKYARRSLGS